ncbi:hypothetical protein SAMN02799624_04106 [Paenibacillus sp. UNC496MF]|uniref:hypothetical protein n=1 Tax=Paenibacillus sp. UNC496MF TaxID=1502753 RepID=UPI0008E66E68|nr:hypothetical protein [Paenibacillus sp. UNC496MF]SFJ33295.1 hypothetical protein SAMN02799624_04106 [Paenibacillus sp. UNC496MF]
MRDNGFRSDQLGGIDGLGRELPAYADAGPIREGRFVGLFYFLWLGQHGTSGPHDNTRILAGWPEAAKDPDHPAWGPAKSFHFWGEPLFGYYLSDDAYVLRKHVQLLTTAGVDFLVFDTTNRATYKQVYDVLFGMMDHVRAQGFRVPRIVFYTNTESGKTVTELYEDIYRPGRYPELWFRWKGRPLIIGDPGECSEEIRGFFTFRLNQWPNEEAKVNGFPWIEFQRPQRVFFNDAGEKEIISVSVAQHPSVAMSDTPFYGYGDNRGRGYRGETEGSDTVIDSDEAVMRGLNIAEQWEFALREDPRIVFVTGWNEWIAMRLQGPKERPVLFVDQATLAFSRDIEPMRGGYGDHYYMQLAGYIRRFKGMTAPPGGFRLEQRIPIGPDFGPWADCGREYRDFEGDTEPRNHPGYGELHYRDETGRNDLTLMKAAHTDAHLYFYVRTKGPITPHTDRHWMLLLIRVCGAADEGWEGYHYIANRRITTEAKSLLERSSGGWNWHAVTEIGFAVSGNELQLEIPRAALGIVDPGRELRIGFKWIDNMQQEGDILDALQHGDTAPEGRLHFMYSAST